MAHLDITHYQSLTKEEERAIENQANRIINNCNPISKSLMDKAEAERQFGFHLYQGGVVPGNELRVVNIEGVDTEACCGTHCDSTAEVGWIKIVKTQRISDGIVRLYYVAYERAIDVLNGEMEIMNKLCETWGIDQTQILPTATRFFNEYKKLSSVTKKQDQQILNLQVKFVLNSQGEVKNFYVKSEQESPTLYFSFLPQFAHKLKEQGKGIVFYGDSFILGLLGSNEQKELVDELQAACKEMSTKEVKVTKKEDVKFDFKIKGQKPIVTKGVLQFNVTGQDFKAEQVVNILKKFNMNELE
uniref:Alanyl-transfer RNA synthetases family profile domain-containing protein n=1 Tax=Strombidium rassoulzadegani TaxID=1082188 RepID=A0A7S3CS37_9SPIT|mmetsp:Transcript_400/g.789  ORF Transcript_400/g.789 Transcript_400/m.789 type:complete len:301 (+) Transcript_400:2042-2944(+)